MLVGNPALSFTRPGNTTPYATGQLIANATAAGGIVLPSARLDIYSFNQSAAIPRIRLWTNVTTGWNNAVIRVRPWSAQPTYAGGDGSAYAIATGSALSMGYAGYDVTLTQLADGAVGVGVPNVGTCSYLSDQTMFFDLMLQSAAGVTPISGQQFIITPEFVG